jgi:hypothetical protein
MSLLMDPAPHHTNVGFSTPLTIAAMKKNTSAVILWALRPRKNVWNVNAMNRMYFRIIIRGNPALFDF